MATKKVYTKGELITSIDDIVSNKNKEIIIISFTQLSYKQVMSMAIITIANLIKDKLIWWAIVKEEQVISKTKSKVIPKVKSNITDCKANLEDIYNE